MIFISAQPDDYFFVWQLELQILNFHQQGISSNNIHVLVGYPSQRDVAPHFKDLEKRFRHMAMFFFYPDTREKRNYIPSLRPHIIKKHFLRYPELSNKPIFYHDSDILFVRQPDWNLLNKDDKWYVSDTRTYLDSHYVIGRTSEVFFQKLCAIVGISHQTVIKNDPNCGGAQYLLKKCTPDFWAKIERDSELLFDEIKAYNTGVKEKYENVGEPVPPTIQSWCADMYAMFWNGLLFGNKIELHESLDFAFAKSPGHELQKKNILHYSGDSLHAPGPVFIKNNYRHYPPYYDTSLNEITRITASYFVVNLIRQFKAELDNERSDLSDVTFAICVKIDSQSRLENLYAVTSYISKYFKTNIILGEVDEVSKIDLKLLPSECSHYLIQQNIGLLHRTKVNNFLIDKANTPIVAILDTDAIVPINQIIESVKSIRNGEADMVSPYDGEYLDVHMLFKPMFGKLLDAELLMINRESFHPLAHRSYGGLILFNRVSFITAGMENEFFTSWGPEDKERIKRMQNLGFKVKRVNGPLFHLGHERFENSEYVSETVYFEFMEEYFRISNMGTTELQTYIDGWTKIKFSEHEFTKYK
ncbi:MAG: hypothetical protein KUL85_16595 [Sphingobacterium mizutaii]|nr:hypothetical protein [Sphingobacterium mizutaii]